MMIKGISINAYFKYEFFKGQRHRNLGIGVEITLYHLVRIITTKTVHVLLQC